MTGRYYSALDQLITKLDKRLIVVFPSDESSSVRPYPAVHIEGTALSRKQRQRSQAYMRVNHAGEISAQALYSAQALTARSEHVRNKMRASAREEVDHLVWCEMRLKELAGRKSFLQIFWFWGSFAIGGLVGMMFEDKWNLGFLAETERQVVEHLDKHLREIPENDLGSRAILEQMKRDEAQHADAAVDFGAAELPRAAKNIMRFMSGFMTKTAYWF